MARDLARADEELGTCLVEGRWALALATCGDILQAAPSALSVRLRLSEIYAKAGHRDHALFLLGLLVDRCTAAGLPLWALAALKSLAALGAADPARERAWVERYAASSAALSKTATRPAPPDPATPVPTGPVPDSLDEAAQTAFARACDLSAVAEPASQVAPLPLLSELDPANLEAVYRAGELRRLAPSALLMRQGDPGDSLCFITSGEALVFTQVEGGPPRELARVGEGTLVGEMALVSAEPRSASLVAATFLDVFVVGSETLTYLARQEPSVAKVLERFTRERLLKNLVASSPLFAPFTAEQRAQLLTRFQGVEYEPGALIVAEGHPGMGLYIVLMGQVEVASDAGGAHVPLARLHSGDVFGEMSLLGGGPTSAAVTAVAPTTALFLPKDDFLAIVEGVPTLLAHFATLANQRAAAQSVLLGRSGDLAGPPPGP